MHKGRVTVRPCPVRSSLAGAAQPCAKVNHKVVRSPEGEVVSDSYLCSCGKAMR